MFQTFLSNNLEIADEGEVWVNGELRFDAKCISSEGKKSKCSCCTNSLSFGLVFQSFNLFPQYTALENLTLAPKLKIKTRAKKEKLPHSWISEQYKQIDENATALLASVGLSDKADFYPFDDIDLPATKVDNTRHQLLFTLGAQF